LIEGWSESLVLIPITWQINIGAYGIMIREVLFNSDEFFGDKRFTVQDIIDSELGQIPGIGVAESFP